MNILIPLLAVAMMSTQVPYNTERVIGAVIWQGYNTKCQRMDPPALIMITALSDAYQNYPEYPMDISRGNKIITTTSCYNLYLQLRQGILDAGGTIKNLEAIFFNGNMMEPSK